MSNHPDNRRNLLGVFSNSPDKKITGKFNYTILFMRYYLHSNKLNEKSISLKEFVAKVEHKHRLESVNYFRWNIEIVKKTPLQSIV